MEELSDKKRRLLRSYFNVWKRVVKIKKERIENLQRKLEQKEKLENLVKVLKEHQKNQKEEAAHREMTSKERSNNFKHRFNAQKSAIEKLTLKLEEKDRLIEELKLGILDRNFGKSFNQTKIEIREIFANCSKKIQCKIAPPPEYNEKFMITTQKAPKIIQELEEKALERAKRREIIFERKRVIEESKKRMVEETLEKKRAQDEEEKKKNLEKIKERRRKEMERQRIRATNKIIFLEKLKKAIELYNKNLLKKGFQGLFDNYQKGKDDFARSVMHDKITLMSKILKVWKKVLEDKYREKNTLADAIFAKNILSRSLDAWRELRMERLRNMQVAEDFYDLMLLNNAFVHWHRYVCVQIVLTEKNMKMARGHYEKHLLFHCFYQWRSLPAVIQLEKSKEMKMKKWREKVWAILPDYKPPVDEYF